ncbi:MAG: hypothetical protein HUU35_10530 [Armatimonadetes bacterium]|nr:hypothetical protein [Armatimonadota bacterium]
MIHCRLLVLLAVASRLLASTVVLDLPPWQERPRTEPDRAGQVLRTRSATLGLGAVSYGVVYRATTKTSEPAYLDLGEGPVGMMGPVSEGWYQGGFIVTTLNGQRLDSVPLSSFSPAETGSRALVDLVWHHPSADLRYRFGGLAGGDCLLLQIDVEPKTAVKSFEVRLVAYPSFFTGWHKRAGARRTLTPGGLTEEGQTKEFASAEGWYALLYDEVFDPARGEGTGACAVTVLPDGLEKVRIEPRSYPSYVTLVARPEARRLKLAFWKFNKEPNAAILARFPALAQTTRELLAGLDFSPRSLSTFDFDEVAKMATRAGESAALGAVLNPRLAELRAWLEQTSSVAQGQPGIASTEAFLAGREEFQELLWQARLAELLDF